MSANYVPASSAEPNQFLLEKIWRAGCLLDALCDPGQFETNAAVALGRQMMERYRNFDSRLVAELMALPGVALGQDRRMDLCLEILDAVSPGRRIIMPLMPLMNSQNRRVRSKIARILGRRVDKGSWARRFRDEIDDRTRANIIESLWGNDSPEIRDVLWLAAGDRNNRVRGNAILALYGLGVASVLPAIRALADSRQASCRATAAWVMGASGDTRFRGVVMALRQDAEASVRAAALRALVQLKRPEATEDRIGLEPRICFCEDVDGVRRVGFEPAPDGAAQPGLLPTDVVVTENGGMVWDYAFEEHGSRPVSALFLIFDTPGRGTPPDLENTFVECLDWKDADDRWSVVRMAAGPEDDFDKFGSVPPLCRGHELRSALAQFDELPRIRTQELPKAVRLLGTRGPGRHLVLLLAPRALPEADLEALELAALGLHVSVDVFSLGRAGNEPLQRLARKTHGVFAIAPEAGISPQWILAAYAGMVHRYEVTYALATSAESAFQIAISPRRRSGSSKIRATRPNRPAA